MKTLTLDWNCVISVEQMEPSGSAVVDLARLHQEGKADVALLATSASENLRDGVFPGSFALFERRITAAGLSRLPVLNTPAVIGLTFEGRSYIVDSERYTFLRDRFWSILFPSVEKSLGGCSDPETDEKLLWSPAMKKWRNAWCDVHNLITHVDHNRDVFVTSNTRDFQRHADALREIGVLEVLTPREAVQQIK